MEARARRTARLLAIMASSPPRSSRPQHDHAQRPRRLRPALLVAAPAIAAIAVIVHGAPDHGVPLLWVNTSEHCGAQGFRSAARRTRRAARQLLRVRCAPSSNRSGVASLSSSNCISSSCTSLNCTSSNCTSLSGCTGNCRAAAAALSAPGPHRRACSLAPAARSRAAARAVPHAARTPLVPPAEPAAADAAGAACAVRVELWNDHLIRAAHARILE